MMVIISSHIGELCLCCACVRVCVCMCMLLDLLPGNRASNLAKFTGKKGAGHSSIFEQNLFRVDRFMSKKHQHLWGFARHFYCCYGQRARIQCKQRTVAIGHARVQWKQRTVAMGWDHGEWRQTLEHVGRGKEGAGEQHLICCYGTGSRRTEAGIRAHGMGRGRGRGMGERHHMQLHFSGCIRPQANYDKLNETHLKSLHIRFP